MRHHLGRSHQTFQILKKLCCWSWSLILFDSRYLTRRMSSSQHPASANSSRISSDLLMVSKAELMSIPILWNSHLFFFTTEISIRCVHAMLSQVGICHGPVYWATCLWILCSVIREISFLVSFNRQIPEWSIRQSLLTNLIYRKQFLEPQRQFNIPDIDISGICEWSLSWLLSWFYI